MGVQFFRTGIKVAEYVLLRKNVKILFLNSIFQNGLPKDI
jgi:hypothetical protein